MPRRFGLLHQPLGGWLADQLKAALIGGALGLAAVEIVYALLALTPLWWIVAAAIFIAAQIAMAALVPICIVPLFYRLTPLADSGLRDRLLALARRAGRRSASSSPTSRGRAAPPMPRSSVWPHAADHSLRPVAGFGQRSNPSSPRAGTSRTRRHAPRLWSTALTIVTMWLAALGLDLGVAPSASGPADRPTPCRARGDGARLVQPRSRTASRAGSSDRPTTSHWPPPTTRAFIGAWAARRTDRRAPPEPTQGDLSIRTQRSSAGSLAPSRRTRMTDRRAAPRARVQKEGLSSRAPTTGFRRGSFRMLDSPPCT